MSRGCWKALAWPGGSRNRRTVMKKQEDKDKPIVRLRPSSYQPSKAELEENVRIDTTPEKLLCAVGTQVRITTIERD